MNIKYKNYYAEDIDGRFDLFEERDWVANKDGKEYKKGDKYKKMVVMGYGYRFENLLRKIVDLELSKQRKVVSVQEYIGEFKRVSDVLKHTLK